MQPTQPEILTTTPRFLCRHIFPDGHRCASPALRSEPFCYYHHTTRKPIPAAELRARRRRCNGFTLPNPADLNNRSGVQLSIALVLQQIASNQIDPKRAGLLLYGLQIASANLPRERTAPTPTAKPAELIEDLTEDATFGTLAPEQTAPPLPGERTDGKSHLAALYDSYWEGYDEAIAHETSKNPLDIRTRQDRLRRHHDPDIPTLNAEVEVHPQPQSPQDFAKKERGQGPKRVPQICLLRPAV